MLEKTLESPLDWKHISSTMLNASLEENQLKIIEREGQCPVLQLEVHMK